jgi:hypothetical protein
MDVGREVEEAELGARERSGTAWGSVGSAGSEGPDEARRLRLEVIWGGRVCLLRWGRVGNPTKG